MKLILIALIVQQISTVASLKKPLFPKSVAAGLASVSCILSPATILVQNGCMTVSSSASIARNLPESTGTKGDKRGTPYSLSAVLKMRRNVEQAVQDLSRNNLKDVKDDLSSIPSNEKEFKRIFDEFSVDISYKQQYLDKNAFIVYYTQGFDGPNRASIESDDDASTLQKAQYGFRNEAWIAVDDARAEVDYLLNDLKADSMPVTASDAKDLQDAISRAVTAFDAYIGLAPRQVLQAATALL